MMLFALQPLEADVLDWAKKAGGTNTDYGYGIAVDVSGNSYVTGNFEGTATFGEGDANETTLVSSGGYEIFVAKIKSPVPINDTLSLDIDGSGQNDLIVDYGSGVGTWIRMNNSTWSALLTP